MRNTFFVRWWSPCEWHLPRWYNNIYKELTFGKFSVFLGKGREAKRLGIEGRR